MTNRYCGGGDFNACAASIWASLDAAGAELEEVVQGLAGSARLGAETGTEPEELVQHPDGRDRSREAHLGELVRTDLPLLAELPDELDGGEAAAGLAAGGRFVTFGIRPTGPDPEFSYIRAHFRDYMLNVNQQAPL